MSTGEGTAKDDLVGALSGLLELVSNGKLMLKPGYAVVGIADKDVNIWDIGDDDYRLSMIDLHFRDIVGIGNIVQVRLARIQPFFSPGCNRIGTLWDILNDVTLKLIDSCMKDSKVPYPCPTDLGKMILELSDRKTAILSSSSLSSSYPHGFSVFIPPYEGNALKSIRGLTKIGLLWELSLLDILNSTNLSNLAAELQSVITSYSEKAGDVFVGWNWVSDNPARVKDVTENGSLLKIYLNFYSLNYYYIDRNRSRDYSALTLLPGPRVGLPLGMPAEWDNIKALAEFYGKGKAVRLLEVTSGEELLELLKDNEVKVNCAGDLKQAQQEGLQMAALSLYIASKNAYLTLQVLVPLLLQARWIIKDLI